MNIIKLNFLLKKKNLKYLLIILFLLLISSLLEVISIGTIPFLTAAILSPDLFFKSNNVILNFFTNNLMSNIGSKEALLIIILLSIFIFLIKNLFLSFFIYFQGFVIKSIKQDLTKRLFNIYLGSEYILFLNKNSSIFIRTILVDIGNTCIYIYHIVNLLKEVLIVVLILILLLVFNNTISILALGLISFIVFIYYLSNKKSVKLRSKKIHKFSAEIIQSINQAIGAIKDVKIFQVENLVSQNLMKKIILNESSILKNNFINGLPRLIIEFVIVFFILLYLFFLVFTDQDLSKFIPYVSLLIISSIRLLPSFNVITSSLTNINQLSIYYQNVYKEIKNLENYSKKLDYDKNSNFIFKDKIELENVSFNYPQNSKKILNNFSLQIKKGSKIGIIGKSGSGKTTLIGLILGLLTPYSGQIKIDEYLLENCRSQWHSRIGYVSQDIYILDDTFKNNIAFGIESSEINDEKLKVILKALDMWDFIDSLPDKLDTFLGDRGQNLSGGQRQRVGIARALYRNPAIIILDEATSSLDSFTQNKVLDYIFNEYKNKTIICVSHEISSLIRCDKIFNLKKNAFVNNFQI